jgi:hypothetical protein
LGWLELELVAGVVWEENTVGLELELAAERSDCYWHPVTWWFDDIGDYLFVMM